MTVFWKVTAVVLNCITDPQPCLIVFQLTLIRAHTVTLCYSTTIAVNDSVYHNDVNGC